MESLLADAARVDSRGRLLPVGDLMEFVIAQQNDKQDVFLEQYASASAS